MIIGVTGTNSSGKDSVGELIRQKLPGWQHFSLSDEIRGIVDERGLSQDRETWQRLGNELRQQFGSDYLAKRILNKATGNFIVTSIRNPKEIEPFRERGDFRLIVVDAPVELRYQRAIGRGRSDDERTITLEEFVGMEAKELWGDEFGQQLGKVLEVADIKITNNGTFEELNTKVDTALKSLSLIESHKQDMATISLSQKRTNYISWDEYFMGVAILSAMRSKDPVTQVGACIVDARNKIVGIGYNGLPAGISDDEMPWAIREGDYSQTKYAYSCHAELNAILNKNSSDLLGCKLYAVVFPCNECAKAIIQSGIREVFYLSDKHSGSELNKAAKLMFDKAGVKCVKLNLDKKELVINFSEDKI